MAKRKLSASRQIVYLVTRFVAGEITFAELKELEDWKKENPANLALFEELINNKNSTQAVKRMQSYKTELKLEQIKSLREDRKAKTPLIPLLWQKILAAASIIALLGFLLFTYYKREKEDISIGNMIGMIDVSPGSNKAILTLQNGKRIFLSDSLKGEIANDHGVSINKTGEGQISYSENGINKSLESVVTNRIETPIGGQFHLVLPDGTKVWLNSASALKYPVVFNGQLRKVELIGEAYFEVAPNKAMPFIVKTPSQQVEVLGTKFNINGYVNEGNTKTTLIEGSVRVTLSQQMASRAGEVILKPGQQAIQRQKAIVIQLADIETAIAWKNGMLEFKDAPIDDIMRQVARWYNLDIAYEGNVPKDLFTGGISRKSNLDNLLKIFRMSRINFKLEEGSVRKKLVIIDEKKN